MTTLTPSMLANAEHIKELLLKLDRKEPINAREIFEKTGVSVISIYRVMKIFEHEKIVESISKKRKNTPDTSCWKVINAEALMNIKFIEKESNPGSRQIGDITNSLFNVWGIRTVDISLPSKIYKPASEELEEED